MQRISIEYRKLSNTHGVSADSIADKRQALKHTEDRLQYLIYDKTLEQLDRSEPDSPVFTDELSGIYLMIRHYEAFAGLRERPRSNTTGCRRQSSDPGQGRKCT